MRGVWKYLSPGGAFSVASLLNELGDNVVTPPPLELLSLVGLVLLVLLVLLHDVVAGCLDEGSVTTHIARGNH